MKERDIVDFSEFKEDENGNMINEYGDEVGCEICYTHDMAYQKLSTSQTVEIKVPRCPKCGSLMSLGYAGYDNAVVSESNIVEPDGNIGYYPIFKCNECYANDENKTNIHVYALIPEPILYNGNHDIMYTGGKHYVCDEEHEKIFKSLFDCIKPSIEQYVKRVVDDKEENLSIDNLMTWCKYNTENAIATWLYEQKLKK